MRVGKYSGDETTDTTGVIAPVQLFLIEEPEAHLHSQVQQVFMRRAYDVLRNHPVLGEEDLFPHSSLSALIQVTLPMKLNLLI
jgi:hypothetical protein